MWVPEARTARTEVGEAGRSKASATALRWVASCVLSTPKTSVNGNKRCNAAREVKREYSVGLSMKETHKPCKQTSKLILGWLGAQCVCVLLCDCAC